MTPHNLLVLSDVHLGSDLVHCAQPEAPLRHSASDRRDRQLAALFHWYRAHRRAGRPWRLVIAGDLVDFVGMSVSPPLALALATDREDSELGLGAAEDHAVYKLRCVARRHPLVFESLARFVAEGNSLVVVRGNHDVDFHWHSVQDEFIRQLALHAPLERGSVEFSPWFYYEQGRVYVEHGHQYDTYCSHDHVLHPVSPENPGRSSRSLSDVLLRYIVRPTRGLLETGHDRNGALDYVRFALGLGVRGAWGLASRFARAVRELIHIWRAHASAGALRIRQHHERRMAELASFLGVSLESLRALASLQRPPVTRSFKKLAQTMMLDRILFGVVFLLSTALAFVLLPSLWHGFSVSVICVAAILWGSRALTQGRFDIEPSRELRDGASRIARLFPAAFVVMGHTHLPEVTKAAGSPTTYVNLGAWSDGGGPEEDAHGAGTRTHLVVHEQEDGSPVAELFVWDETTGPQQFVGTKPPVG